MNEARENRDLAKEITDLRHRLDAIETPGERSFNFWVGVFVLMIGVSSAVFLVYWLLSVIFGTGSL